MEEKVFKDIRYASSNINEWRDLYNVVSWENITNLKKLFNNFGLTTSLTNYPMSEEVDLVVLDCRDKIDSDLTQFLQPNVCAKEEIKLEYIGYSAILITYYWYTQRGGMIDINKVPYIGNGKYQDYNSYGLLYF